MSGPRSTMSATVEHAVVSAASWGLSASHVVIPSGGRTSGLNEDVLPSDPAAAQVDELGPPEDLHHGGQVAMDVTCIARQR